MVSKGWPFGDHALIAGDGASAASSSNTWTSTIGGSALKVAVVAVVSGSQSKGRPRATLCNATASPAAPVDTSELSRIMPSPTVNAMPSRSSRLSSR